MPKLRVAGVCLLALTHASPRRSFTAAERRAILESIHRGDAVTARAMIDRARPAIR